MSGPPLTRTLWCQGVPGVVPTPFPAPVRALVAGSPPGLSPSPRTSSLHILFVLHAVSWLLHCPRCAPVSISFSCPVLLLSLRLSFARFFSGVEPFSFCAAFVACLCAVFHPWALLQLNSRQPPGYFIDGPAKVLLVLCRYGAPWSAYQYHSFLGLLVSGHAGKHATETPWS